MGYSFKAKNIEEAIKITSGNSKFLEKEECREEIKGEKVKITSEIVEFLGDFKDGFLSSNEGKSYAKALDDLIDHFLCSNEREKEVLFKKICKQFKKFYFKVLVISNGNKELEEKKFLESFLRENNSEELLVLQPIGKMGKDISSLNALKNYSDLLINGFNKEGLFFYTRDKGVFISTEGMKGKEIISMYARWFSKEFYEEISSFGFLEKKKKIEEKFEEIKIERNCNSNEINLIHISDLHLGLVNSNKRERLINLINEVKGDNNYIIITGDILDNPLIGEITQFLNFEKKLKNIEGVKEIFCVQGNHDCKILGNFDINLPSKKLFEEIINQQEQVKIIDEELLLIKVNSNEESTYFAKGKIGTKQMDNLEKKIEEIDGNKKMKKIIILHHHPKSMEKNDKKYKTLIKKFYNNIKKRLIVLEDSKEFLEWCMKNEIHYVLNGHEHLHGYKKIQEKNIHLIASASSLGATHRGLPEDEYTFCNILKFNKEIKKIETLSHYYEGKRNKNKDNMTVETISLV